MNLKSDGTNTVLSYAFPSTLISQSCFLRFWDIAKYILWIGKQKFRKTKIEFYLLPNRLCVFFVVVSKELYVKKFNNVLE